MPRARATVVRGVALVALALSLGGSGFAAEAEIPVGVRSQSMGYAGAADPASPSAASLNIGAASLLNEYAVEATTANLAGLLRANYLAASIPLSERQAVGFDWLGIGADDDELGFTQNRLRLGYSASPRKDLGLGFGVNYRTQRASLDGASLGAAAGWSTDLGILWTVPRVPGLRAAFSVRNWMSLVGAGELRSGAWVRVDDGPTQRLVPRSRVLAMTYARDGWTGAVDWNDGWRMGVERTAGRLAALRAGAFVPTRDGEGPTFSAGAALNWAWGSVDYAFVAPSQAPTTSHFGLTVRTSYLDPPVIVEGVAIRDLYPALREFYARAERIAATRPYDSPAEFAGGTSERIGEFWLHNPGDAPVRVGVRVEIDGYTGRTGTEVVEAVRIGPGERVIVPIRKLLLADEALELTEGTPVEARVHVADVRNPSRRRAVVNTTLLLHARNELLLDDVAKLGVFITPTDPTVRDFGTRILQATPDDALPVGLPSNLRRAVALFAGLGEMAYEGDPNLPRESGTIDAIKFPSEMVGAIVGAENGAPVGDCDDATVLVCSLFEALGIATALIQTPQHVLMAFDLGGIPYGRAQATPLGDVTIAVDGNAWAPLETTLLSRGFAEAWRVGLAEARSNVLDSVTVRSAWERYGVAAPVFPSVDVTVSDADLRRRIEEVRTNEWFQSATAPFTDAAQAP
ncbi:hypothetical protein HN371_01615 [Candidatus Poribacteria bacterium]|nr:hypothetical protein [Candidatus Poribacteria bacterium]MBT5712806.1 hypothetical protein [Candidatus Poribacteria bacterium]MBT7100103.1 hypothetical protein [Candidatus Poribacteria bacterium]MBT7807756.1 hypothetical protein [Candidatus Poribacteria bacterium]